MTAIETLRMNLGTASSQVTKALFKLTHNSFALLGLAVVSIVIALDARPDLRHVGENLLTNWLQQRQIETTGIKSDADAIDRATATDPKDLPRQQAAVAYWLSKKYHVAPEPVGALVAEAYEAGAQAKLDPTLILAVMAIESGFNPFAQSAVGAQGLMQVMTTVHTDKFDNFGGKLATFDPVANLRVGVKVLQECIARTGGVEPGLRCYVGATTDNDDGYAAKVMAEHARLQLVAQGKAQPMAQLSTPATAPGSNASTKVALAEIP